MSIEVAEHIPADYQLVLIGRFNQSIKQYLKEYFGQSIDQAITQLNNKSINQVYQFNNTSIIQ